ncbi:MAG: hypothetical protein R6X02_26670 [Enhygromyxa sp.]
MTDDDDTMVDEFLDCTGKRRKFRLHSYARGMFLDATEILAGETVGMRLVMKADEHGHVPWGEMRKKIRARLAERDVAVDPETGRLEILRGVVRAHLHSVPDYHEDDDDGPVLIVDDRTITWRELGRMLGGFEGWNLRVEILDVDEG